MENTEEKIWYEYVDKDIPYTPEEISKFREESMNLEVVDEAAKKELEEAKEIYKNISGPIITRKRVLRNNVARGYHTDSIKVEAIPNYVNNMLEYIDEDEVKTIRALTRFEIDDHFNLFNQVKKLKEEFIDKLAEDGATLSIIHSGPNMAKTVEFNKEHIDKISEKLSKTA